MAQGPKGRSAVDIMPSLPVASSALHFATRACLTWRKARTADLPGTSSASTDQTQLYFGSERLCAFDLSTISPPPFPSGGERGGEEADTRPGPPPPPPDGEGPEHHSKKSQPFPRPLEQQ